MHWQKGNCHNTKIVETEIHSPSRVDLTLDRSDIDSRKNFIWCQFRRPLLPSSPWDLDLTRPMYHFFFSGPKNGSM